MTCTLLSLWKAALLSWLLIRTKQQSSMFLFHAGHLRKRLKPCWDSRGRWQAWKYCLACQCLVRPFLPAQLNYAGKAPACLPKVQFPSDWHATFTPKHWSNEDTMFAYINNVVILYVVETCHTLKLPHSQLALALFDHFEGHLTPRVQDDMDTNNILVVDVPANCTDRLQPIDLSIDEPLKTTWKPLFRRGMHSRCACSCNTSRCTKL